MALMKWLAWSAALLAMGISWSTSAEPSSFETLYGQLLKDYWRPAATVNGVETTIFDYAAMHRDAQRPDPLFDRITKALAAIDPTDFEDTGTAKAFWINAYNFGAMKLIVEHYPVDSIRSFKISLVRYPWSKKAVAIGGKQYSLKEIEKDILLRRYEDSRIVFAVSCAAVSCPDRIPEPFRADRVDEQLDDMIRTFFTNPAKGLALDQENGILRLSWILDKDRQSFGGGDQDLLTFVRPYLAEDLRRWLQDHPVRIEFFDHDWTLNDIALAARPQSPR